MITNVNKKVICIKDIPSNIIEEAFFILKTDVNKTEKLSEKRREIVTKEAENFLKEYIVEIQKDKSEDESGKYFKNVKIKAVWFSIAIIAGIYILFMMI